MGVQRASETGLLTPAYFGDARRGGGRRIGQKRRHFPNSLTDGHRECYVLVFPLRFGNPRLATALDRCPRWRVTSLVPVTLCQPSVPYMAAASRPSPPLPRDPCSNARLPVARVVCALRAALRQHRHRHRARRHPWPLGQTISHF
jgi:hypothetical protein